MRLRIVLILRILVTLIVLSFPSGEVFESVCAQERNPQLQGHKLPGQYQSKSTSKIPPSFGSFKAKAPLGRIIERDFEENAHTWKLRYDTSVAKLLAHERSTSRPASGLKCERVQFSVRNQIAHAVLEHTLPPSRVQDALKISLKVRSNRPGAKIGLRVVFPLTRDPKTGRVLERTITGSTVEKTERWELLEVQTFDKLIDQQLVLWRGMMAPSKIDVRGMYVDRVYLILPLAIGTTDVAIDSLRYGPLISPQRVLEDASNEELAQREPPDVSFQLDRMMVDKKPFFPIVVPDHGENPLLFKEAGANTVWVKDVDDLKRIAELNRHGLWVTGKPPSANSDDGSILPSEQASLMPFPQEWDGILFWNLGARIPSTKRKELIHWTEQIRNSDRRMKRPIHADVKEDEGRFSRDIDLLSVSKHILNTPLTTQDFRNYIRSRSEIAEPGTFITTLLQTEPSHSIQKFRADGGFAPIQTEPEQLRLLLYSALSAGIRGITYWSSTALDGQSSGSTERRLTMSQLNLELELLEPFLASATLIGDIPVYLTSQNTIGSSRNQANLSSFRNAPTDRRERRAFLSNSKAKKRIQNRVRAPIQAALFRCDFGQIVLPVWYDNDSQYVPGQLAANNVKIMVQGYPESARAWEVTTTGLNPLEAVRAAGGTELTLKKFDQTTAIIISSDQNLDRQLRMKIRRIRNKSAKICVDLARAKLQRVIAVDNELTSMGRTQPDAPQIRYEAEKDLSKAERYLNLDEPHSARLAANDVMQYLRILQRAHWNDTRHMLENPNSTQHGISFQSIPDFHRLLQKVGTVDSTQVQNLMRSGSFEDDDTMLAEGWEQELPKIPGVIVFPELHPKTRTDSSEYCLRMTAIPENELTQVPNLSEAPIRFLSPEIPVRRGQIVHLTGWVKIDSDIQKSINGFRIYNNINGSGASLQWNKQSGWVSFRQLLEVTEANNFFLTLELSGLGDIRIDDLKVTVIDPNSMLTEISNDIVTPIPSVPASSKNSLSNALEFLDRFPTLVPRKTKPVSK